MKFLKSLIPLLIGLALWLPARWIMSTMSVPQDLEGRILSATAITLCFFAILLGIFIFVSVATRLTHRQP